MQCRSRVLAITVSLISVPDFQGLADMVNPLLALRSIEERVAQFSKHPRKPVGRAAIPGIHCQNFPPDDRGLSQIGDPFQASSREDQVLAKPAEREGEIHADVQNS